MCFGACMWPSSSALQRQNEAHERLLLVCGAFLPQRRFWHKLNMQDSTILTGMYDAPRLAPACSNEIARMAFCMTSNLPGRLCLHAILYGSKLFLQQAINLCPCCAVQVHGVLFLVVGEHASSPSVCLRRLEPATCTDRMCRCTAAQQAHPQDRTA